MTKKILSTIAVLLFISLGIFASGFLSSKKITESQIKDRYQSIGSYKIVEPVLFRNIDKLKSGNTDPDLYMSLGTNFYTLNDFSRAIYWYQRAWTKNPNNFSAHYNAAQSYIYLKDYLSAKQQFLKAIEINPNHYTSYIELASLYVNHFKDKISEMEDLYKQQIEKNPEDENFKSALKDFHRLSGKTE